jgi:hypothetical protein
MNLAKFWAIPYLGSFFPNDKSVHIGICMLIHGKLYVLIWHKTNLATFWATFFPNWSSHTDGEGVKGRSKVNVIAFHFGSCSAAAMLSYPTLFQTNWSQLFSPSSLSAFAELGLCCPWGFPNYPTFKIPNRTCPFLLMLRTFQKVFNIFVLIQTSGWPDWANFRLLGERLLWAAFLNCTIITFFLEYMYICTFFSNVEVVLFFDKYGLGYVFCNFCTNSSGHPANNVLPLIYSINRCRT